jgi:hypothetical protein
MLDASWVHGASHVARAIFDARGSLSGMDAELSKVYGAQSLFAGTSELPASLAMAVCDPVALPASHRADPAAGTLPPQKPSV